MKKALKYSAPSSLSDLSVCSEKVADRGQILTIFFGNGRDYGLKNRWNTNRSAAFAARSS